MSVQHLGDTPRRSWLVEEPEHYLYSSARQYAGETGLLDVEVIDWGATEGYVWL